jgi:hypothetical protein
MVGVGCSFFVRLFKKGVFRHRFPPKQVLVLHPGMVVKPSLGEKGKKMLVF